MLEVEYARELTKKWQIAPQFIALPRVKNITIRRAMVTDAQHIQEMHNRLSQDSIFFRYLRPYHPTLKELQDVCSMESDEGYVLIATVEEQEEKVIGIAYYCVNPQNPKSAEPAILVEDAHQGCGVGKKLLNSLFQHAIKLGVKEFICYADPANHRVLNLIERCGMNSEIKYCHGMKEIRVRLNSNP